MQSLEDNNALILFRVGPVLCCAPSLPVVSIITPPKLTSPPGTSTERPGIFKHAGKIATVFDLRFKFGVPQQQWRDNHRVIINNFDNRYLGFVVDEILEIIEIPSRGWGPLPAKLPQGIFSKTLLINERIYLYSELVDLLKIHESGYLRTYIEFLLEQEASQASAASGNALSNTGTNNRRNSTASSINSAATDSSSSEQETPGPSKASASNKNTSDTNKTDHNHVVTPITEKISKTHSNIENKANPESLAADKIQSEPPLTSHVIPSSNATTLNRLSDDHTNRETGKQNNVVTAHKQTASRTSINSGTMTNRRNDALNKTPAKHPAQHRRKDDKAVDTQIRTPGGVAPSSLNKSVAEKPGTDKPKTDIASQRLQTKDNRTNQASHRNNNNPTRRNSSRTEQPKESSGLSGIIFFVLFISLLSGGGYYAWQYYSQDAMPQTASKAPTSNSAATDNYAHNNQPLQADYEVPVLPADMEEYSDIEPLNWHKSKNPVTVNTEETNSVDTYPDETTIDSSTVIDKVESSTETDSATVVNSVDNMVDNDNVDTKIENILEKDVKQLDTDTENTNDTVTTEPESSDQSVADHDVTDQQTVTTHSDSYHADIQRDEDGITIIIDSPEGEAVFKQETTESQTTVTTQSEPATETGEELSTEQTEQEIQTETSSSTTETEAGIETEAEPGNVVTKDTVVHIVVRGDTLWHISKRYLNNPYRYPELARLSKIKNPDLIYPGDRVRIIIRRNK